jgi:biopolymer transport protein ExbD
MAGKISTGGGGGRRGAMAPNSDPNVIPFIDILLVLLIIFMVTAPIPTVDIRVDLPPPNPVPVILHDKHPTIVALRDEGGYYRLYVDTEEVDEAQLADRVLDHAIRNNPGINPVNIYAEAKIFVRADQSTAYGNVVRVMSTLQEANFAQVGIFNETAQEEG